MGDGLANEKTWLLERQIQTWDDLDRVCHNHMIPQIRTTLEARIAKEREKQVERTAEYSNDEEALRREFGIEPAPYEAESAGSVADEGRGIVDTVQSREPAGAAAYVEETEPEDGENSFITGM